MTERIPFHVSLSCIGEGNGNPLQYSCLENPRDGGGWWAAVYGVAQSWTRLKRLSSILNVRALDWMFVSSPNLYVEILPSNVMEKEMATHSSVLAWRIPGTGEPGGLLSMGSHRVGHD